MECNPRINGICPHLYPFQNLMVSQANSTREREHQQECAIKDKGYASISTLVTCTVHFMSQISMWNSQLLGEKCHIEWRHTRRLWISRLFLVTLQSNLERCNKWRALMPWSVSCSHIAFAFTSLTKLSKMEDCSLFSLSCNLAHAVFFLHQDLTCSWDTKSKV